MLIPKPIRKMIAVLRGSLSPRIIALTITLGFTFGLVPGFSGIHAFILLLFVLMNIHLGLFLISAGIGKALCLAAAPLLFHLGAHVQNVLQPLLTFLGKLPVIGFTDFTRYAVAGGIIAGPVLGLIIGLLFAKFIVKFRQKWLKLEEGSEAYKKWTSKKWVRFIDRVLIGKKTKDLKTAMEGKSPTFRKAGIVIVGLPLLLVIALGVIGPEKMLGNYTAQKLAKANGAEVNIASLGLSPVSGSLTASGVQITDPDKPAQNQLAAEQLAANAGIYGLLTGKVVIDNVTIKNLTFNTPRKEPGKVFQKQEEQAKQSEKTKPAPSDYDINSEDIAKVDKYFKNTQKLKDILRKIQKLLPEAKDETAKKPVPQSIREYLTAKAPKRAQANFIAKSISLDKINLTNSQFGLSNIKLTNLSDAPIAYGKPINIELESVNSPKAMKMQIEFQPDGTGKITGDFTGFDLADFKNQLSGDNSLKIENGTANGMFAGTISKDKIDLALDLNLKDMNASSSDGLFGLDAKTTSEVFSMIETINTQIRLVGPISSPSVAFDTKGLSEQFKLALVAAGKERLANELGDHLEENLGKNVSEEVKKVIGEPKKLVNGLNNLLGGKKKN